MIDNITDNNKKHKNDKQKNPKRVSRLGFYMVAATGLPAEIAGDLCAKAQAVSELRGENSLRLMCILFFYGLCIDYIVIRRATHSVPLPCITTLSGRYAW